MQPVTLARALEGWLAGRYPGSAPEVGLVTPPAQGYSNETWLVDATLTVDGRREDWAMVLRTAPAGDALVPHYDLSLQYRVMAALAHSEVPVPALIGYEEDPSLLGRPFYLMRCVAGRVPNENPQYHVEGWLAELSPEALRSHWFAGVAACAQVSRVNWRAAGLAWLAPDADPLAAQLAELAAFLDWTEVQARPYPLIRRALAWLAANRPHAGDASLVWGDAKLGNLVFGEAGHVEAALDWEGAHIGDAREDLAWFLVLDRSLCEGYGTPRLPHLPSRAETIACWEAASGLSAAGLPWFEMLAATRLALIMARLGKLFADRGLLPAGFEMDTCNGGYAVLARLMADAGVQEAA